MENPELQELLEIVRKLHGQEKEYLLTLANSVAIGEENAIDALARKIRDLALGR